MADRHQWVPWLLLSAGCGFEPEGARPIEPPLAFHQWWLETQACSAIRGRFEELRFYVVPGESFACPSGRCVGRWEPGNQIYLADRWIGHELVVRHEMLHALLGKAGHPDPPFGQGCPLTWATWPSPSLGGTPLVD